MAEFGGVHPLVPAEVPYVHQKEDFDNLSTRCAVCGMHVLAWQAAVNTEEFLRTAPARAQSYLDQVNHLCTVRNDLNDRLNRQARELREAREKIRDLEGQVEDWMLVADGIKHDPRCPNHFAGDPKGDPCLRCNVQELKGRIANALL